MGDAAARGHVLARSKFWNVDSGTSAAGRSTKPLIRDL